MASERLADYTGKPLQDCTNLELFNALLHLVTDAAQAKGYNEGKKKLYYISISIAKSMLEKGVIDREVFAIIDTKLLEKYRPISATLLSGNPLT